MVRAGLKRVSISLFHRSLADRRGSVVIEFAIAVIVLMLMLFGLIDFGMIAFIQTLMEGSLRDAARYGLTGQAPANSDRMSEIYRILSEKTLGFIDMSSADLDIRSYASYGSLDGPETYVDANHNGAYDTGEAYTDSNGNGCRDSGESSAGAGEARDIVIYSLTYDWPLITPVMSDFFGENGRYTIRSSIAVRNEPWSPFSDLGKQGCN